MVEDHTNGNKKYLRGDAAASFIHGISPLGSQSSFFILGERGLKIDLNFYVFVDSCLSKIPSKFKSTFTNFDVLRIPINSASSASSPSSKPFNKYFIMGICGLNIFNSAVIIFYYNPSSHFASTIPLTYLLNYFSSWGMLFQGFSTILSMHPIPICILDNNIPLRHIFILEGLS